MNQTFIVRFTSLITLVLIAFGSWLLPQLKDYNNQHLQVTFFDVGQGDAIYIETPSGIQVLIDGGPSSAVLIPLSRELGWFDNTIDVLLGTHQDLDHVSGLVDVLQRYVVETIILTEGKGASGASKAFLSAVKSEGSKLVYARSGQNIILDASTTLEILSPSDNPAEWDSNTGSIVAMLRYGSSSFLLTGDAPQGIEEYLVRDKDLHLKADVLKLGHHGSKTSSSKVFLETVQPLYTVVSAGKDNRYGHPHDEVIKRVEDNTSAQIVSTAESGSITFLSDGSNVWVQ